MIVRDIDSALLLITQPDHAALAARLMEGWCAEGYPALPERATVQHAIAEHDNGWREPDRAPLRADGGRLLDFVTAPAEIRRGVWPRGVDRLADDPYAAALVAQHAIHVLDRHRGGEEWAPFFETMTTRRNHYLARAGRTERELLADYFFVRMGDLMSLVICNAWTGQRSYGRYQLALDRDGVAGRAAEPLRLVVSPDPFDGRVVAFEIEARRLPAHSYGSLDDARAAFESAPLVTIRGAVAGA